MWKSMDDRGLVSGYAVWNLGGAPTHYFINHDGRVFECTNLPRPPQRVVHFSYPDSQWVASDKDRDWLHVHAEYIGNYRHPLKLNGSSVGL
jgi:hypothetical protein